MLDSNILFFYEVFVSSHTDIMCTDAPFTDVLKNVRTYAKKFTI